ncbi:unnamed protein product, partial [Gordionus sp. m RMFG-2023]
MAYIQRFVEIKDGMKPGDSGVYLITLSSKILRETLTGNAPNVYSRQFFHSHHKWSITFSLKRSPFVDNYQQYLTCYLTWRNTSNEHLSCSLDASITLIHPYHYSEDIRMDISHCEFNKSRQSYGTNKFVSLDQLTTFLPSTFTNFDSNTTTYNSDKKIINSPSESFESKTMESSFLASVPSIPGITDNDTNFLIQVEMKNVRTFYEQTLDLFNFFFNEPKSAEKEKKLKKNALTHKNLEDSSLYKLLLVETPDHKTTFKEIKDDKNDKNLTEMFLGGNINTENIRGTTNNKKDNFNVNYKDIQIIKPIPWGTLTDDVIRRESSKYSFMHGQPSTNNEGSYFNFGKFDWNFSVVPEIELISADGFMETMLVHKNKANDNPLFGDAVEKTNGEAFQGKNYPSKKIFPSFSMGQKTHQPLNSNILNQTIVESPISNQKCSSLLLPEGLILGRKKLGKDKLKFFYVLKRFRCKLNRHTHLDQKCRLNYKISICQFPNIAKNISKLGLQNKNNNVIESSLSKMSLNIPSIITDQDSLEEFSTGEEILNEIDLHEISKNAPKLSSSSFIFPKVKIQGGKIVDKKPSEMSIAESILMLTRGKSVKSLKPNEKCGTLRGRLMSSIGSLVNNLESNEDRQPCNAKKCSKAYNYDNLAKAPNLVISKPDWLLRSYCDQIIMNGGEFQGSQFFMDFGRNYVNTHFIFDEDLLPRNLYYISSPIYTNICAKKRESICLISNRQPFHDDINKYKNMTKITDSPKDLFPQRATSFRKSYYHILNSSINKTKRNPSRNRKSIDDEQSNNDQDNRSRSLEENFEKPSTIYIPKNLEAHNNDLEDINSGVDDKDLLNYDGMPPDLDFITMDDTVLFNNTTLNLKIVIYVELISVHSVTHLTPMVELGKYTLENFYDSASPDDNEQSSWCLEVGSKSGYLNLSLYYSDIMNISRNYLKYVSWTVTLLANPAKYSKNINHDSSAPQSPKEEFIATNESSQTISPKRKMNGTLSPKSMFNSFRTRPMDKVNKIGAGGGLKYSSLNSQIPFPSIMSPYYDEKNPPVIVKDIIKTKPYYVIDESILYSTPPSQIYSKYYVQQTSNSDKGINMKTPFLITE